MDFVLFISTGIPAARDADYEAVNKVFVRDENPSISYN